jgi:hypothetical protein
MTMRLNTTGLHVSILGAIVASLMYAFETSSNNPLSQAISLELKTNELVKNLVALDTNSTFRQVSHILPLSPMSDPIVDRFYYSASTGGYVVSLSFQIPKAVGAPERKPNIEDYVLSSDVYIMKEPDGPIVNLRTWNRTELTKSEAIKLMSRLHTNMTYAQMCTVIPLSTNSQPALFLHGGVHYGVITGGYYIALRFEHSQNSPVPGYRGTKRLEETRLNLPPQIRVYPDGPWLK